MPSVVSRIESAASGKTPFLITLPNLNTLVNSLSDAEFRESVLLSDLCPVDGMGVVWIARIIGVPVKHRIAGSDLFDAIKSRRSATNPFKLFLFGGGEGIAESACHVLNAEPSGISCVGSIYPGFGSIEEMSHDDMVHQINASNADFLSVSLGAKKGQQWLLRNHYHLQIPVRAHLGAAINFEAGTLKRAPLLMQKLGFEWLWRIKEEPYLWKRYWSDGTVLLRLLLTRALPLMIWNRWLMVKSLFDQQTLVATQTPGQDTVTISLVGPATARHIETIISAFKGATVTGRSIQVEFPGTTAVDARFLGLLLVLIKTGKAAGVKVTLVGLTPRLELMFRLNGLGYLLSSDSSVTVGPSE
jgi:N-acetylglucosaminyldiphosphoundecaprenol N-acetyl-beta-D-mannosaminyltransferase